jgi:Na+/H+-dicarboxylate symporter
VTEQNADRGKSENEAEEAPSELGDGLEDIDPTELGPGDGPGENASTRLLIGIVAGAVLGGLLGWLLPETGESFAIVGNVWLRMLRMLVVPLIVASMVHGVARLGDVRKLGGIGGFTMAYYMFTSTVAIAIGLVLVNVVQPGVGVDITGASSPDGVANSVGTGWQDMIESLITPNLVEAAANTDILPLIIFSLAFGGVLTTIGKKGERVIDLVEALLEAVMKLVHLVMLLAPIGIFGLVAARFGKAGGGSGVREVLAGLGMFSLVVVVGLAIHMTVVLGSLVWLAGRRNPLTYARTMGTALMTAFATASSAATLPVTMSGTEEAGVDDRASRFVLPLGATINMDGSALYEAVAAMFIAQAWGIDIGITGQIMVVITAVLSSVGAAGIPEAGLVTMVVVLQAVGLPLEGLSLLLAIDWLLDRFRTAVNVWGDAVGAAVIERRKTAATA